MESRRSRRHVRRLRRCGPWRETRHTCCFTIGLIGTGMLGVPVLAGSSAFAISEAMAWGATLDRKPSITPKFYAVLAVAMALGVGLNYAGLNAVQMLFWSAVVNGVLAPPLIVLVVLILSLIPI